MPNTKISGLGFHHIAVQVKDFARERKFFEALGMKPFTEWTSGSKQIMLMEIGDGGLLELFSAGTEDAPVNNRYIHFALHADDVEAAYATAIQAGGTPIMEPAVRPIASSPVKITLHCAFVRAPGGEEVEFIRLVKAEPCEV